MRTPVFPGPATAYYEPVPSSGSTTGDQDELVLYLNDGTVYLVSNYWISDNQFHYVMSDGVERTIKLDQIDLQRTVDVNARRGVILILRSAPNSNNSQ